MFRTTLSSQLAVDHYAANHEQNIGAVSDDIQRILDETVKDVPQAPAS